MLKKGKIHLNFESSPASTYHALTYIMTNERKKHHLKNVICRYKLIRYRL